MASRVAAEPGEPRPASPPSERERTVELGRGCITATNKARRTASPGRGPTRPSLLISGDTAASAGIEDPEMNENETTIDEIADGIYRISTPILPERPPGLHVQPVPRGGRRAADVPHRAQAPVPIGPRGDRPRDTGRAAALDRVLAHGAGRVRRAERAARRGAARGGRVQQDRRDDLGGRPRDPAATRARGRRAPPARAARGGLVRRAHVPHGWDYGFLFEASTRTLFCGDLFTQPGARHARSPRMTSSGHRRRCAAPSTTARTPLDAGHARAARAVDARTLACMHGAAWQGDASKLLLALADALGGVTASEARRWGRGSLVAAVPAPRPRDPRGGIHEPRRARSRSAPALPDLLVLRARRAAHGHLSGGTPNSTSPQTGHG